MVLIAAGDEELVGTASRRIAVATFDEPCAVRHDICRRERLARSYTSQYKPTALHCAVKQLAEHVGFRRRHVRAVVLLDNIGLHVSDCRLFKGGLSIARSRVWRAF